MIEVKNISKEYGKNNALNDVSFTVKKGEILGFLGPNGAGKSTTMKIITGYIPPSKGTVMVDGFDVLDDNMEVKKRIGYLPENPPLYYDMIVKDYLNFVAQIKGIKNIKINVDDVIKSLNLEDVKNRLIKNLSKGYKQRVGLAQAILGNPDVLILDEPTIGLDPSQILEIRELIKKLGQERTIILSSHILPEVSQICDRVIIINKGEIKAIDTPENLSKSMKNTNVVNVRIVGEAHKVLEIIKNIENINKVEVIGEKEEGAVDYKIETNIDVDIRRDLFKLMAENDCIIIELNTQTLSLEDVFVELTTKDITEKVKSTDDNEAENMDIVEMEEEDNE